MAGFQDPWITRTKGSNRLKMVLFYWNVIFTRWNCCLVAKSRPTLCGPWTSPGKNTRVGCHSLLHGIFMTQGSNLGLLHCRKVLYCLNHQGSLKAARLLCLWNSSGKNTEVSCHSLLQGDLSDTGIEPQSPALQADSLPPNSLPPDSSPGKPSED